MMERQDIERLLQLYMDGSTTISEEKQLARYFATHDVPQQWQPYKDMFAYIDRYFAPPKGHRLRIRPRMLWTAVAAVVAGIIFILTLGPALHNLSSTHDDNYAHIAPATIGGSERSSATAAKSSACSDVESCRRSLCIVVAKADEESSTPFAIPVTPEDRLLRTIPFLRLNVMPHHYLAVLPLHSRTVGLVTASQMPLAMPEYEDVVTESEIDASLQALMAVEADIDQLLKQSDYRLAIDAAMKEY